MVKKKELSTNLRNKIVNSNKEKMGYKSLSKKFDVPVSIIQNIIKKYKSYQTIKNLNNRGKKRKMFP